MLLLNELRAFNYVHNDWKPCSHISKTPIVDLQDVTMFEEPKVEPPPWHSPNHPRKMWDKGMWCWEMEFC